MPDGVSITFISVFFDPQSIMTTTPRPNAVEAAKQGNPKAIALLLNQALKSHGCTAQVLRNDAALRILIEGALPPDESTIASLVENGLRHLDLGEITPQVQLYGQQQGQAVPAWSQSIHLGADPATANIFSFDTVAVELPKPAAAAAPIEGSARPPARSTPTIVTPEMPNTYLTPAIILLLLTIFPLSLVSLVFATQVSSKYNQGDYAGAESASRNAKLWCWINVGIAAPIYMLVGGLIILGMHSFSGAVARAGQEREVTDRLNTIMRAEQAYYLENSRFASNLSDLGQFPPTSKSAKGAKLKEVYTYQVTVLDGRSVQVTAIPNRKDFHSFTAGAIVVGTGSGDSTTQSIICQSETASMMAVKMPVLKGATLGCAPGSEPVTAGRREREESEDDAPERPPYDVMG
jgi:type II secretory pathway pseudopilin PulG